MEMNLAVAYTEYQLLQIESLIWHYDLKNVMLIVHNNNNRISDWLIDHSLFDKVIQLPVGERSTLYNLSKEYIRNNCSAISELLGDKKINILIGAQDENTVFAIIKYYAKPKQYWNVEDGNANYVKQNIRYRSELFLKKMLFSLYGYSKLDIRYGHGLVKADKIFRIYPKLSMGNKDCIFLGDCLGNYLKEKTEKIRSKINWIEQYKNFDTLVVSDVALIPAIQNKHSANELYKFHPDTRVKEENITYIKEKIPIEFLPLLLNNLKTVRYDYYSGSILNMLVFNFDVKIQINYTPPDKVYGLYLKKVIQEFRNKVEVISC